MDEELDPPPERSYGCTFGCGNPYDFVLTTVQDSSTEFLCLPCFIVLARDMVIAINDPTNVDVLAAIAYAAESRGAQVPGPAGKARGRNKPVNTPDDGILDDFDAVITVDDLPAEFR